MVTEVRTVCVCDCCGMEETVVEPARIKAGLPWKQVRVLDTNVPQSCHLLDPVPPGWLCVFVSREVDGRAAVSHRTFCGHDCLGLWASSGQDAAFAGEPPRKWQ